MVAKFKSIPTCPILFNLFNWKHNKKNLQENNSKCHTAVKYSCNMRAMFLSFKDFKNVFPFSAMPHQESGQKFTQHCKSTQFTSVSQSYLTLCHPMDCSTPGFPCPSSTLGACSNSCPLSQWCHPTISSSVIPFSSHLPSFPASGSFPMSQFFTSGGQSIRASASASVLPMNMQGWFPLGWTGWISLQSKGLSRVFFNTTIQKHQFFSAQISLWSNFHILTWLLEKP